jgi:hypothetical protein
MSRIVIATFFNRLILTFYFSSVHISLIPQSTSANILGEKSFVSSSKKFSLFISTSFHMNGSKKLRREVCVLNLIYLVRLDVVYSAMNLF